MELSRNQKIGLAVVGALALGAVIYFAFIKESVDLAAELGEDKAKEYKGKTQDARDKMKAIEAIKGRG